MEIITKEILKHLQNNHTKVELKQDFNGNYYNAITDTIYVSGNINKKQETSIKSNGINKKAAQFVTVCHECIHSIQNKVLHILNIIFSNISLILGIICIIWGMFGQVPLWFKILSIGVVITSLVFRLILETGAVNGSVKLALGVVEKGLVKDVLVDDVKAGADFIKKYRCLALIQMISDKIILLTLLLIIR